jgi:hypothetical protein
MKRKLWLATALAGMVAAAAFGDSRVDGGQGKKPESGPALNVTGKWSMALEMSMGTGTPSLELKQDEEKLTGTYTGRYGTFKLQGTLKDRQIRFWFNMEAEGTAVEMSFAGELAADGQSMKGTAEIGGVGDATWTAKREKDPGKWQHGPTTRDPDGNHPRAPR